MKAYILWDKKNLGNEVHITPNEYVLKTILISTLDNFSETQSKIYGYPEITEIQCMFLKIWISPHGKSFMTQNLE